MVKQFIFPLLVLFQFLCTSPALAMEEREEGRNELKISFKRLPPTTLVDLCLDTIEAKVVGEALRNLDRASNSKKLSKQTWRPASRRQRTRILSRLQSYAYSFIQVFKQECIFLRFAMKNGGKVDGESILDWNVCAPQAVVNAIFDRLSRYTIIGGALPFFQSRFCQNLMVEGDQLLPMSDKNFRCYLSLKLKCGFTLREQALARVLSDDAKKLEYFSRRPIKQFYLFLEVLSSSAIELQEFHKLTSLALQKKGLRTFPDLCTDYGGLFPQFGELEKMPTVLTVFRNIKVLNLSGNQLSWVPESLFMLPKLVFLNLSRNSLKALPATLGCAGKMTKFYVHKNKLTALPAGVGHLTALRELNIRDNALKDLPPEISSLIKLSRLYLGEPPRLSVLRGFLASAGCMKSRANFYNKQQTQAFLKSITRYYERKKQKADDQLKDDSDADGEESLGSPLSLTDGDDTSED